MSGIANNYSGLNPASKTELLLDLLLHEVGSISLPFTPTVRTPGISSDNGVGTIAAGFQSFTIWNTGMTAGVVGGVSFPAGASATWSVVGEGDTLDSLGYDASGTTFIITTVQ